MASVSRTRNYACIVYCESALDNWETIISESKIPCFISPLHDKDKYPNGEDKKPHYHVLVMFDSVKTEKQAREFFDSFGGVGCEVVNSCRAYARYLCHLDCVEQEKFKYPINEVREFGGASYVCVIGTMSDKNRAIAEMIKFVDDNGVIAYFQLLKYAQEYQSSWFDALINGGCTFTMKEYIKSKYWYDHLEDK